ncbi:unnamed protein product [Mytilus edulis]|uniref:Integrase zinc-binding domain-containing protein n=1 Tax=Mytilus edulis TaxID=6550 RepID=A0A8S3QWZ0_MYTED|nr:unnamed protein product [Mytilus edulis]
MSDRVSVKQAHSIKDIDELIPKHIQDLYSRTVEGMALSESRSVSCTSPVGIIGLTIRSIRNVTSDNNISIMGMPTSYSNDDLRQLQNQDKHLSTIIAWLTLNYTPSKQELQMQSPEVRHLWQCKSQLRYQDGILSYIWEDPVGSRILFVTPDNLKDELLRCCHDLRSSGHLGQDKTLSKLRKTAYWYKMSTDCKIYVSSCHVCNRQKKACRKARADLGQYHSGVPLKVVLCQTNMQKQLPKLLWAVQYQDLGVPWRFIQTRGKCGW